MVQMTKAAIWLRVSTGEQHVENQLPDLQAWAERRGWEVARTYTVAESAFRGAHQKHLTEVYADAQHGHFTILLVWALDRLSREGPQAILEIVNRMDKAGCQVYSYHETWTEVAGSMRELLLAIVGWIAREESERRSQRTKAGMARARAGGKMMGRPKGALDRRKRRTGGYFDRYRGPEAK